MWCDRNSKIASGSWTELELGLNSKPQGEAAIRQSASLALSSPCLPFLARPREPMLGSKFHLQCYHSNNLLKHCGRKYVTLHLLPSPLSSVDFNSVKDIHVVVQQISGTFSSCNTEARHPWNDKSPSPPGPGPWKPPFHFPFLPICLL